MLDIIIYIALAGLVVYLLTTLVPMAPPFRQAIYIVATVSLFFYLLAVFGIWNGFGIHVHRIRG